MISNNYHLTFSGHCYAIAGPGIGKDCVFPFIFDGKKYNNCARSIPTGQPWCKTDMEEANSTEFRSYGICHSACVPADSNRNTILN